MPVHVQWWKERTSTGFTVFLMFIWAMNAITFSSFVAIRDTAHTVPLTEVLIPICLTIFMSILHCHISQTQGVGHELLSGTLLCILNLN